MTNLDGWIEMPQSKKRLVLIFLLQTRTFDLETILSQCPERLWIDEAGINPGAIPGHILRMSAAKLNAELSLYGGEAMWT